MVVNFQEVFDGNDPLSPDDGRGTLFAELEKALPGHLGYFCECSQKEGLALFVRTAFQVTDHGGLVVYDDPNFVPGSHIGDHTRKVQWAKITDREGKKYGIMNIHGHWAGKDKGDTPARLGQSRATVDLLDTFGNIPVVLCGDFNLRPDTESVHMIEKRMNNLVVEHKIMSTRTSLYTYEEKFADYVFLSHDARETSFAVMPDEVSDHVPLFVEFD